MPQPDLPDPALLDRAQQQGATRLDDGHQLDCSIAATLGVIGDRWTLLILRDLFRGVRRFGQIRDDLGIAKNILSDRLQKLVDADIVEPVQYQDRPARFEYRLTSKGIDLSPALVALMHWGDRWYAQDQPPTVLVHDQCGTPLEQITRCPACSDTISPTHIASRPGPGTAAEPLQGEPS